MNGNPGNTSILCQIDSFPSWMKILVMTKVARTIYLCKRRKARIILPFAYWKPRHIIVVKQDWKTFEFMTYMKNYVSKAQVGKLSRVCTLSQKFLSLCLLLGYSIQFVKSALFFFRLSQLMTKLKNNLKEKHAWL